MSVERRTMPKEKVERKRVKVAEAKKSISSRAEKTSPGKAEKEAWSIPSRTEEDYAPLPGETSLERDHRLSREGTVRRHAQAAALAAGELPEFNPLFQLADEKRAELFVWLRECPYHDAVQQMLEGQGLAGVTPLQLNEFFQAEAQSHWQHRIERAATEANALVSLVERNPVRFSSGILAALGQEAFRQIASGQVAPEAMTRMANLFLKARGDERAEQALEMKREQMQRAWRSQTEQALEAFAEEVNRHPEARAAFEALRAELLRAAEGGGHFGQD